MESQAVVSTPELLRRIRKLLPADLRAVVMHNADGGVEALALAGQLLSQQQHFRLDEGTLVSVVVENAVSIGRAISGGRKESVVRLIAEGEILFDDTNGVLSSLRQRAAGALAAPRPDYRVTSRLRFAVLGGLRTQEDSAEC
jgi:hypothetical protein